MAEHRPDWETKIAFCRDRGVSAAAWDEDDRLVSVTLGPLPPVPYERRDHKPLTPLEHGQHTRNNILSAGPRLVGRPRVPGA